MCEDLGLDMAPTELKLGVMALAFTDLTSLIHPRQGGDKVREGPGLAQVVGVHHLPARQFLQHGVAFLWGEGGRPIPAGNAGLISEGHGVSRVAAASMGRIPIAPPLLTMLLRLLLPLLIVLLVGWGAPSAALASMFHLEGPLPADLGIHGGSLSPCSSSAHCARQNWSVADPDAAVEFLASRLEATEAIRIVERQSNYLHATATSSLFGFVDDLELLADPVHQQVQARSVSRLGDSDLGVNARRLEWLSTALERD